MQGILVVLGDAAEALVQLRGGAVGRVRDLAGECQAGVGAGARVVVAAAPRRIQLDRADLRVGPRRLSGGRLRARGHDHESAHALRVGDRPLDRAVTAQGRAHDDAPLVDVEQVGQAGLGVDLVARGDHGEARAPRLPVGSEGRWACGSLTATQDIRGHHVVAVRVDDAPRPTIWSHQPGCGWPGAVSPYTCASPVSACRIRTALEPASSSSPHVS